LNFGGIPVKTSIVNIPAFQAIGLKWQGTFEQAAAGEIKELMKDFQSRSHEIKEKTHSDLLLGLSYFDYPDGFTLYSAFQVEQTAFIPIGMHSIAVPELTYAVCRHHKGDNINETYRQLFAWIDQQGYLHHKESIAHYEEYPAFQDPFDPEPEFSILLPISPHEPHKES
jgi:predicted transcriptional regulator YdeE